MSPVVSPCCNLPLLKWVFFCRCGVTKKLFPVHTLPLIHFEYIYETLHPRVCYRQHRCRRRDRICAWSISGTLRRCVGLIRTSAASVPFLPKLSMRCALSLFRRPPPDLLEDVVPDPITGRGTENFSGQGTWRWPPPTTATVAPPGAASRH